MRHRKRRGALGVNPTHRQAMLRNLTSALLRHEKIVTTEAKAKEVRRLAEKLITLAKRENLHARRQVISLLRDKEMTAKLFSQLNARFSDRNGGYTRVYKYGLRRGDGSPLAIIELCDYAPAAETDKKAAAEKKKKKSE
jgi:large subunit ribosomal protein L17